MGRVSVLPLLLEYPFRHRRTCLRQEPTSLAPSAIALEQVKKFCSRAGNSVDAVSCGQSIHRLTTAATDCISHTLMGVPLLNSGRDMTEPRGFSPPCLRITRLQRAEKQTDAPWPQPREETADYADCADAFSVDDRCNSPDKIDLPVLRTALASAGLNPCRYPQ